MCDYALVRRLEEHEELEEQHQQISALHEGDDAVEAFAGAGGHEQQASGIDGGHSSNADDPSTDSDSSDGDTESSSGSSDDRRSLAEQECGYWMPCTADPFDCAGTLARHGVVGLRSLLAAEQRGHLSSLVDTELSARKQQAKYDSLDPSSRDGGSEDTTEGISDPVAKAAFARWFGEVRQQFRRYDLKLSIDEPAVKSALRSLCTALAPLFEQVTTVEADIVELAAMITDTGAEQQMYHTDTLLPSGCGAPLYTCFVALQDIDVTMGPTWVIPGSHTEKDHRELRVGGPEGSTARRAAEARKLHMSCLAGS